MNPRALAIRILARVEATDAFLGVVLDAQLSEHAPEDPRDAALVTELCYGTMRRRMVLDRAIESASNRRLEQMEELVLAAVRVGAYQLFFSRIPKHAAVGETVQALKALKLARAAPFANAVLRKLSSLEAPPLPSRDELAEHLAVRESHPLWLVERWLRRYGPERAESMLVADNQPAPVVVRANSSRVTRDALLEQLREVGVEASPTALSTVGVVLPRAGRVQGVFGYSEGLWQVQDEAAQLVSLYASFPEGARVLDACAAPGGKACHLAERHEVVAMDVHRRKLQKLEGEARRLGISERVRAVVHDLTRPHPGELGDFDSVLLDAPCSGLGTLRRHPELRYRRKEEDIPRLARLQGQLLERCQERVRSGGVLVYSVCSPEPEEGREQVEAFLREHPEFRVESPGSFGLPVVDGFLVTLPGPEGLDGFFAARLRRS